MQATMAPKGRRPTQSRPQAARPPKASAAQKTTKSGAIRPQPSAQSAQSAHPKKRQQAGPTGGAGSLPGPGKKDKPGKQRQNGKAGGEEMLCPCKQHTIPWEEMEPMQFDWLGDKGFMASEDLAKSDMSKDWQEFVKAFQEIAAEFRASQAKWKAENPEAFREYQAKAKKREDEVMKQALKGAEMVKKHNNDHPNGHAQGPGGQHDSHKGNDTKPNRQGSGSSGRETAGTKGGSRNGQGVAAGAKGGSMNNRSQKGAQGKHNDNHGNGDSTSNSRNASQSPMGRQTATRQGSGKGGASGNSNGSGGGRVGSGSGPGSNGKASAAA